MDPRFRPLFNAQITPERYEWYVRELSSRLDCTFEFRLAESPLFLPDGRATTLVQCPAGSDSCSQQASAGCGGAFDVVRQSTENGTLNLIYACRAK